MTDVDPPLMPEAPRLLVSVETAAELLSISRTRMYSLLSKGAIRSVGVGRLRRIPATALNEYVDQLVSTYGQPQDKGQS